MPSKGRIEAQTLYANILEEIKLRIANINHCTMGFSGLTPPFVKEVCYLQIRMICELVAMGCLAAHGDIKGSNSSNLRSFWSAADIMNALEKLHPHFYPQPIKQTRTASGIHIEAVDSALAKSDFLAMYGKCGDALHRGNIKKLLKGQFPNQINYPEITTKAQLFIDLLSNHMLVMHTGEQAFLAMLYNSDNQGRVQVAIVETPKGSPMDFKSPDFLRGPPSET